MALIHERIIYTNKPKGNTSSYFSNLYQRYRPINLSSIDLVLMLAIHLPSCMFIPYSVIVKNPSWYIPISHTIHEPTIDRLPTPCLLQHLHNKYLFVSINHTAGVLSIHSKQDHVLYTGVLCLTTAYQSVSKASIKYLIINNLKVFLLVTCELVSLSVNTNSFKSLDLRNK